MSRIRHEYELFIAALTFLTRIPVPTHHQFSAEVMATSSRYYPVVGLLIGTLLALVFAVTNHWLPVTPSVVITLIAGVLLTGAFHEDGLADACDGLGGGWNRDDVLRIMKDSRVGSYAVVGLTLAMALKIALLVALPAGLIPTTLIVAHTCSRALSTSYLFNYPYVQLPEHSKVGHYARSILSPSALLLMVLACFLLAACVFNLPTAAGIAAALIVARTLFGRFLLRRIGGVTGDCLGAAQQIAEVIIYVVIVSAMS